MVPIFVTPLNVRLIPRVWRDVNARDLPTIISRTDICRFDDEVLEEEEWIVGALVRGIASVEVERVSFRERDVEPIWTINEPSYLHTRQLDLLEI